MASSRERKGEKVGVGPRLKEFEAGYEAKKCRKLRDALDGEG